jgi:polysaccharide export outer membrane protein
VASRAGGRVRRPAGAAGRKCEIRRQYGMLKVALVSLTLALASSAMAATEDYLLQPGDLLMVSVWKEAELTGEVLVRPDGRITVPLAGEIEAGGHSVEDVRSTVDERLRKFIPQPAVTVVLRQSLGNQIFVIGKVNHPGQFPINRPIDVMQALSLAGGMTPFAAVNDIRVLRRDGDRQTELPFRYEDMVHGHKLAQNIVLRPGDTVVVP